MTVLNSDAAPEVSPKSTHMPQVRMASSLTLSLMKMVHLKALLKDVVGGGLSWKKKLKINTLLQQHHLVTLHEKEKPAQAYQMEHLEGPY